jgi:hypothetical protein
MVALWIAAGVVVGLGITLAYVSWRAHAAEQPVAPAPDVPQTCETCSSWDWAAGQTAMRAHAPFAAVMGELQPWQVGATHRSFEPNPEYETTKEKLLAAVDAGDDELAKTLQAALDELNPKRLALESALPPAEFGGVTWADFGACLRHLEGRVRTDGCGDWKQADSAHRQINDKKRRLAIVQAEVEA